MKYLKTHEGLFNFLKKKKLTIPKTEFFEDVNDILLDLKDDGFDIWSPSIGYKGHDMEVSDINLIDDPEKIRYIRSQILYFPKPRKRHSTAIPFKLGDVSETILRLFDYCESVNAEMKVNIIGGVNILFGGNDHESKDVVITSKETFNNACFYNLDYQINIKVILTFYI